MTPKQTLLAHLEDMHPRKLSQRVNWSKGDTISTLQHKHSWLHHHLTPTHRHAGSNRGPDDRPSGWKTGRDVVQDDA